MGRIRSFVTPRRAVVGSLVVLLLAGVTLAVVTRGPSEAERAYALACEAVRAELDEPEKAVFPAMGDEGVEVYKTGTGYTISSILDSAPLGGRRVWRAVVWHSPTIGPHTAQGPSSNGLHIFTAEVIPAEWRMK